MGSFYPTSPPTGTVKHPVSATEPILCPWTQLKEFDASESQHNTSKQLNQTSCLNMND